VCRLHIFVDVKNNKVLMVTPIFPLTTRSKKETSTRASEEIQGEKPPTQLRTIPLSFFNNSGTHPHILCISNNVNLSWLRKQATLTHYPSQPNIQFQKDKNTRLNHFG